MGGRWPYSCCFKGCCFQDLFNIAHSILVQFLSSFFSICFVSIHVVHPYSRIDTTAACKKKNYILIHWMETDFFDIVAGVLQRGDISPISVHNILKLCISNTDRSNERKWLYTLEKGNKILKNKTDKKQSVSSRIWTRIAVSISCDNNHYTTGTSFIFH